MSRIGFNDLESVDGDKRFQDLSSGDIHEVLSESKIVETLQILQKDLIIAAKEAEQYVFEFKSSFFDPENIPFILKRIEEVSAAIDRLLSLYSRVEKIHSEVSIIKMQWKLEMDKLTNSDIGKPEYLIAKGFAFQERLAFVNTKYVDKLNTLLTLDVFIMHGSGRIKDKIERQLKRLNQVKMDMFRVIEALRSGSITHSGRLSE